MAATTPFWQGDFGVGVLSGNGLWETSGINPCVPLKIAAAGVSQSIPQPQFKLGTRVKGDLGSEFILGKLVLASATDLLPGQAYTLAGDYTMVLTVTSTPLLRQEVVISQVWAPQLAAGTYYIWGQCGGRTAARVVASTVVAGLLETTATAGALKGVLTATAGATSIAPGGAYVATTGFTLVNCVTVNGSPTINVSDITGITYGTLIAGTGVPANAIVAAIRKGGIGWYIDIGTNTAGSYTVLQNCTASATNITMTFSGTVPVLITRPTQTVTN